MLSANRISSAVPTTFGPNNSLYGRTLLTNAAESMIRSTDSASRCQVCCVQAQIGFALVAGDDLQTIGGQLPETAQQIRITAVEGLLQPASRVLVGLAAHQADQRAVDLLHLLEQFQHQVTPQEPGRPGQQHRPHLSARARAATAHPPASGRR